MTDLNPEYLSLRLGQAAKAGKTARGLLSYRVLCDADRHTLFLALVANERGGWFSPERVPLERIEALLSVDSGKDLPVSANVLRDAFVSRSVNNAGFLAAVLVAEGLLKRAGGSSRHYERVDGWDTWKSVALSEPGEPFVSKAKNPPVLAVIESELDVSQAKGKKRKKAQSGHLLAEASLAHEAIGVEEEVEPNEMLDHDSDKPEELGNAPVE